MTAPASILPIGQVVGLRRKQLLLLLDFSGELCGCVISGIVKDHNAVSAASFCLVESGIGGIDDSYDTVAVFGK